ncbi:hypothetical protein K438DRAFT_1936507 [Mycena galopus ATCC 62051]|nr:hypothetical protein K438DRAFT_1936507 [Mycena galopus ATCC 62051]
MASSSNLQPSIKLHFKDRVRVAGETIAGHVDLNMAHAQELHIHHLWIKCRGALKTQILVRDEKELRTQSVVLFQDKQSLWKLGSAFPDGGSQVLSHPFQFQLPSDSHPSFHCTAEPSHAAAISYSLEVVAEREGRRANHQIRRVFAVVPVATAEELRATESLQQSWTGPWRHNTPEKKMRRGMWGDYSQACVTLSIPDLPSYPICTPIPIIIQISTETKSVPRSDRAENRGKALFPAPPTHSSQLKQVLRRVTNIKVQGKVAHQKDTFDLPMTRGLDDTEIAQVKSLCEVEAAVDEPGWIQKEKDRGVWKRSVRLALELQFPLPPTHSTDILDWQYELGFIIPCPGAGNNLKISSPIQLCASSSDSRESTSLPPQIYLSPSYFSGRDHDWGDDTYDAPGAVGDAIGGAIGNTIGNAILNILVSCAHGCLQFALMDGDLNQT